MQFKAVLSESVAGAFADNNRRTRTTCTYLERQSMAISTSTLQSFLVKGELEASFIGKVSQATGEKFTLRKEQSGSPVAYSNFTRKYAGSKGSKIVTFIDARADKIYGATTTAEGL